MYGVALSVPWPGLLAPAAFHGPALTWPLAPRTAPFHRDYVVRPMAPCPWPGPPHGPAPGRLPLARPLFLVRPMAPCPVAWPYIRIPAVLDLSRGRSVDFGFSWFPTGIRRSGTDSRRSTTFRRRVWPSRPYMSRSPSRDFLGFGQICSRPPLAPTQISTPGVVFRSLLRDFGLSGLQSG